MGTADSGAEIAFLARASRALVASALMNGVMVLAETIGRRDISGHLEEYFDALAGPF